MLNPKLHEPRRHSNGSRHKMRTFKMAAKNIRIFITWLIILHMHRIWVSIPMCSGPTNSTEYTKIAYVHCSCWTTFSRWPQKNPKRNCGNTTHNSPKVLIWVFKPMFSGPRNSMEYTKIMHVHCWTSCSRWPPRKNYSLNKSACGYLNASTLLSNIYTHIFCSTNPIEKKIEATIKVNVISLVNQPYIYESHKAWTIVLSTVCGMQNYIQRSNTCSQSWASLCNLFHLEIYNQLRNAGVQLAQTSNKRSYIS